jgi:GDPmannose 4,6-dehydratase
MAAMSHVHVSFEIPETTASINALGPLRLLEAMRVLDVSEDMRFYQASSSEMYGRALAPQDESTPFSPCSPYGTAKLYAYWSVKNYREAYGLYAANGILFNHESPLRGEEFVTRKITKTVCEIEAGLKETLVLGNLDSKRDWGHAKDYVDGIWRILQQDRPDDYVLATGESHSVREFVEIAFSYIGKEIVWKGEGENEKGYDRITNNILVKIDPTLFRPSEVNELLGDPSKAKNELGWQPQYSFDDLIINMMDADRITIKKEKPYAA